jgi:hypothetical protein
MQTTSFFWIRQLHPPFTKCGPFGPPCENWASTKRRLVALRIAGEAHGQIGKRRRIRMATRSLTWIENIAVK